MQPPILTLPRPDPRSPVVLPRGCQALVRFGASGWPVALVIPTDCGLLDLACGYWHGLAAANGDDLLPAWAPAAVPLAPDGQAVNLQVIVLP